MTEYRINGEYYNKRQLFELLKNNPKHFGKIAAYGFTYFVGLYILGITDDGERVIVGWYYENKIVKINVVKTENNRFRLNNQTYNFDEFMTI